MDKGDKAMTKDGIYKGFDYDKLHIALAKTEMDPEGYKKLEAFALGGVLPDWLPKEAQERVVKDALNIQFGIQRHIMREAALLDCGPYNALAMYFGLFGALFALVGCTSSVKDTAAMNTFIGILYQHAKSQLDIDILRAVFGQRPLD